MTSQLLAIWSLWRRELVRFYRQRHRVVGALGLPLLVWLFIGSGFGSSFHPPDVAGAMSYREYFYPGVMTLVVLFTAIFSSISVIEDFRDGFLDGVLVTPAARSAVVLGKMLGGASQAFVQGGFLLGLAPLAGVDVSLGRVGGSLGALGVVSFSVTALGFATAWGSDSTQGYHAIMNLVLIPMWVLSGAFFPPSGAPLWLQAVMYLNPMTYALAAVRGSLYPSEVAYALVPVPMRTALSVVSAFGVAMFVTAVWRARRLRARVG